MQNFGRNVSFSPLVHEIPVDEAALLNVLQRHRGRRIGVCGSLHSWSRIAACDDVLIDVSQLNSVRLHEDPDDPKVTVGAGCRIERLVEQLNLHNRTLPSLGLITQQTVAGATSSATHGSGRHCLSHFIQSMRIATYDKDETPVIRQIDTPEELNAARCGLGSLGIITSLTLTVRQQYVVEEHLQSYDSLSDVITAEPQYPLQQFFLIPWYWRFYAQHRRESTAPRSRSAGLYRLFWSLGMDRGLHWIVILLARRLPDCFTRLFFRFCLPLLVPCGWRVVDRSDKQLTMQHQLFRHIETEMFVTAGRLEEMMAFTRWLLEWAAGESDVIPAEWQSAIESSGRRTQLQELHGQYLHHYPVCVRRVLPDTGLISMSSGLDETWYAVSFISYAHPANRTGFLKFSDFLIVMSGQVFSARPHWGKQTPLPPPDVEQLYPRFTEFLNIRDQLDPTGAFRPNWFPGQ